MRYDFDEIIDRRGTGDVKHCQLEEYFGRQDLLPLWVADMDFATPPFIVDAMRTSGADFAPTLARAQELGYAEADPTADVEGYDAARKVAIMATIAFHTRVTFRDVYTEGITKITRKDISYASALGWKIKLIGLARNTEEGVEVRVHPMLIPISHPLATVAGSYNAV